MMVRVSVLPCSLATAPMMPIISPAAGEHGDGDAHGRTPEELVAIPRGAERQVSGKPGFLSAMIALGRSRGMPARDLWVLLLGLGRFEDALELRIVLGDLK